ncbi:MAG TPA: hypothetical protein VK145_03195 [Candidatus Nanoarchaeia archaeon]|nr:hypothetical protein [Candidatus Nanoarchaeia archaeon]
MRKKLRTKAGVTVVADLSIPKTRIPYKLVHELYGMVEKIVRPDVESVRNKVDKAWEPPQQMFRIKNAVNILVKKGEYYAIPVMKEFEDQEFGHDVEVTVLTVSIYIYNFALNFCALKVFL